MKKIFSYFFFFPSFIFLLFSSFFFNFFFQLSAQTGPNTPATIVNDNFYGTVAWTNPGNANASDNFYASAAGLVMGQPTQYLKATNMGFAINACDDINGIEVRVEWSQTGTAITQDKVYLVVDGTISTTVNKSTGGVLPNPADLVTLFGGAGDPWSQTLKGSDVNKPGFGIAIAVIRSGGGAASTPQIDHVTITLYHSTPPPMTYNSSTVSQVTTLVNPNTQNNQIIRVEVTTNAGCPPIDASSFTFNMNGTTNLADIQNAKLFYTGTNPVFNNDNQLGSTIGIIPGGNFDINGFIQPLKNGTNYFWLAVDVVAGAIINNFVDGECPSLTVDGIARTPTTTAPGGSRTITAPITFTVGNSGETYTTIQSAYNAIPVTPANTYIIDVYSDYNSALETFPISFSNKSNTFKIIVRPALGETGILCAGTLGSQGLWLMDNAQNIVIEGRAGNLGILKEFTIRNTKIAAPYGTAFRIINDSKNIVFSFLNIEAETTSGASLDGIITIGTTTLANGNDDIKVLNCLLRDLSVGGSGVVPTAGVYSNGTAAKTNDFIKVDSCQFSQGGFPAINIFANSSNATITNNHLYYPGGMTISSAAQGININSGSDHIVSGNFIGGTAASCGGIVFNIASGTVAVTGISVTATGNNFIENNTVGNMRYTTTYNLTSYPLVGINVAGNGNFTVGASGKGNLIGSMSGTANFRLTQNGTSGEGIGGIINNSTGTVTVAFNNIGAVTQDGSFAGADAVMILSNSGAGSITIDSNIIGSSSAGDNILMSSNSNLFGIYNSGATGMTCTNNTVKWMNYMVLSATTLYGISNTAGPLICTNNILKNLTSNNLQNIINHSGTTATITSNIIQDISLTGTTGTFNGINTNSTSAVTIGSNIIGSSAANNISIACNDFYSNGINNTGSGALSCIGNTIQNIIMTSTGINPVFQGISTTSGVLTFTQNTIQNITCNSTGSGNAIIGIYINSATTGHTISKNTVTNLIATGTTAVAGFVTGIRVSGGSGLIEKNLISDLQLSFTSTGAEIDGMDLSTGAWDVFNNVVLLQNAAITNSVIITGIWFRGTTSRAFHNTVKIAGSVASGTAITSALEMNATGAKTIENNIFQNLRTGTGTHYSEKIGNTTTSLLTDYNYLEVANNQSQLCSYLAADKTFAQWQAIPVGPNDLNGTVTLDNNGRIAACFTGANKGTNLLATVSDDKDGIARDAMPWMGAFEINTAPWNYYWVGGNGSWTDLTHWSCNSGGAGGVSTPTINDNVYIDNNSGAVTITLPSGTYYTKGFYMTGAGAKASIIGQGVLLPRP